jgi:hypothetical protein
MTVRNHPKHAKRTMDSKVHLVRVTITRNRFRRTTKIPV